MYALSEQDSNSLSQLAKVSCIVNTNGATHVYDKSNKLSYHIAVEEIEDQIFGIQRDINDMTSEHFSTNVHIIINVNSNQDNLFILDAQTPDSCSDVCTTRNLRVYSYLEYKPVKLPANCKGINLHVYVVRSRQKLLCFDLHVETLYSDNDCFTLFENISKRHSLPFYTSFEKLINDMNFGNYFAAANDTHLFFLSETEKPCCGCIGKENTNAETAESKLFDSHEKKIKDLLMHQLMNTQNKFLSLEDVLITMSDNEKRLKGNLHLSRIDLLKTIQKRVPKSFQYDFNSKPGFFNGSSRTLEQFNLLTKDNTDDQILSKILQTDFNKFDDRMLKSILELLLESEAAVSFKMGAIHQIHKPKHIIWPIFFKKDTKMSTVLNYIQTYIGPITEHETLHILQYLTLKKIEMVSQLADIMHTQFPIPVWKTQPLKFFQKVSAQLYTPNPGPTNQADYQNDSSDVEMDIKEKTLMEKHYEKTWQFNEILKKKQDNKLENTEQSLKNDSEMRDDPNLRPTSLPQPVVNQPTASTPENTISTTTDTTSVPLTQELSTSENESTTPKTTRISPLTTSSTKPITTAIPAFKSTTTTTPITVNPETTTTTQNSPITTSRPTSLPLQQRNTENEGNNNQITNNQVNQERSYAKNNTENLATTLPDSPTTPQARTDKPFQSSPLPGPNYIQDYIKIRFVKMDTNYNNFLSVKELKDYAAFISVYGAYYKKGMKEYVYAYANNGISLSINEFNAMTKRLEKERVGIVEKLWTNGITQPTTTTTPTTTSTTTVTPTQPTIKTTNAATYPTTITTTKGTATTTTTTKTPSTTTTTISTTTTTTTTTTSEHTTRISPTDALQTSTPNTSSDMYFRIPEPDIDRRPRVDRNNGRNRSRNKRHILTEFFADLTGLAPEEEFQQLLDEQKLLHLNEEDIKNTILNISKTENDLNKSVYNITRDISKLFKNDEIVKTNFVKMLKSQANTDQQLENIIESIGYITKLNVKTTSIFYNLHTINMEIDRHINIIERIQQGRHIMSPNLFMNVAKKAGLKPYISLNLIDYKIIYSNGKWNVIGRYPVITKSYTNYNIRCIPYPHSTTSAYILEPQQSIALSIDGYSINEDSMKNCITYKKDLVCPGHLIKQFRNANLCEKEIIKLHISEKCLYQWTYVMTYGIR